MGFRSYLKKMRNFSSYKCFIGFIFEKPFHIELFSVYFTELLIWLIPQKTYSSFSPLFLQFQKHSVRYVILLLCGVAKRENSKLLKSSLVPREQFGLTSNAFQFPVQEVFIYQLYFDIKNDWQHSTCENPLFNVEN